MEKQFSFFSTGQVTKKSDHIPHKITKVMTTSTTVGTTVKLEKDAEETSIKTTAIVVSVSIITVILVFAFVYFIYYRRQKRYI